MIVLALGIGANSTVFTLINAVVVRPVLMEDPDEVVGIYARTVEPPRGIAWPWHFFSYPEYRDLREFNRTFADVAAYATDEVGLAEDGLTRRTQAFFVSANYFRAFGVPVAYGRDFTVAEERPGSEAAVAIVSHDFWVRNGRDPGMLGSVLRVSGQPVVVVGIAAEGFSGHTAFFSPKLWLPLGLLERVGSPWNGSPPRLDDAENGRLSLFGRLDEGSSVAEASADLGSFAARLGGEQAIAGGASHTFVLAPLGRFSVGNAPAGDDDVAVVVGAAVLAGMTGIVLLIACINLANMLLARGAGRRTEMAIRQALGGGRLRLVRQLLLEGSILALAGGALGLIAAYWAAQWLVSSVIAAPLQVALTLDAHDVRPDLLVFAATFASCIVATLLFGLGPALRISGDVAGVLTD